MFVGSMKTTRELTMG